MGLETDAAQSFNDALIRRDFATTMTIGPTPTVYIREHPQAVVYFRRDILGALTMDLIVDGGPRQRLDTALGMDALADFLVQKVAGDGPPSA